MQVNTLKEFEIIALKEMILKKNAYLKSDLATYNKLQLALQENKTYKSTQLDLALDCLIDTMQVDTLNNQKLFMIFRKTFDILQAFLAI